MCTAAFDANRNAFLYFTVVSPLYVCVILLFLSGIPTLEEPWNRRYGKDPAFRDYRDSVPPLIPFIPPVYRRCSRPGKVCVCSLLFFFTFFGPHFSQNVKAIFCCEFPLYAKSYPVDGGGGGAGEEGLDDNGWERSSHHISPESYQKPLNPK